MTEGRAADLRLLTQTQQTFAVLPAERSGRRPGTPVGAAPARAGSNVREAGFDVRDAAELPS
jgi:hypothetical protein